MRQNRRLLTYVAVIMTLYIFLASFDTTKTKKRRLADTLNVNVNITELCPSEKEARQGRRRVMNVMAEDDLIYLDHNFNCLQCSNIRNMEFRIKCIRHIHLVN